MPVRKVVIDKANRLYQMPPGITAFAATGPRRVFPHRSDSIDLGNFHWPVPFEPDHLPDVDGIQPASDQDLANLREELADWLAKRFGVRLVKDKELFIGGRLSSLVYQLCLAFVDSGDVAFVPSVGIPLYRSAVTACDGEPIGYDISAKSDWTPRFDRLSTGLGRVARLLFLNSPHNPTGSELSTKEISELVWLAGRENVLVVNDAAYAGLAVRTPASLLGDAGGKRVGVELGSFSYTFGLPPLPFGFAAGNREVISGLKRISRLQPPHLPRFYIHLAIQAIRKYPSDHLTQVRDLTARATAEANQLLDVLALERSGPGAVPYVWARIEKRTPSTYFAKTLLRRHRILVAPGLGFGENGEGHLRFSTLAGPELFAEAVRRIRKSRSLRKRAEA
jgi:aspartate/methionine/tyrosine aminotransferase